MVVALVALFVALSGTALAFTLAANSVKSKNIVNGQVKLPDLAGNAVNSSKVKDGSLGGADVTDGSLSGNDIDESSLAGGQITGVDAAQLSGKSLSFFAAANQVHVPTRVGVNDPVDGVPTTIYLAENGTISVTGDCFDNGTAPTGTVRVSSTESGSTLVANNNTTGAVGANSFGPGSSGVDVAVAFGNNQADVAELAVLAPSGATTGVALDGIVSATTTQPGSDCEFTAALLG